MTTRLLPIIAALCLASPALAQPTLDWFTIDSGGSFSSAGAWELAGTVGQPDVGISSAGGWEFFGGFWYPNITPPMPCDPDYNQDGNIDQDDVTYLINVIAGGLNPTNRDPDFDCSGTADQDDITALINVIAGGNCPC
jgi:hypothetical protein